jgi:hypothetical protein
MAEPHVISALKDKRAELGGEIEAAERRLEQLRSDCRAVDQVLRLYGTEEPEAIASKTVRVRNQWFERGELSRLVLDALRVANGTTTSMAITLSAMTAKGYDTGDRRAVEDVQKNVTRALRGLEACGSVREAGKDGKAVMWGSPV